MLMHTQASRLAHQLLNSRETGALQAPLSDDASLTIADGYDIAKCIVDDRIARGEIPVGRKIGFTNRKIWGRYGAREPIEAPIWGMMYDTSVRYFPDNHGVFSLAGMVQPRIEPEIIFQLRKAPGKNAGLAEIADCIEWMAHGYEIVVCPFPNWQFEAVDAIAAFGLHGALIIGEQRNLSAQTRRNLAELLTQSSISLSLTSGDKSGICAAGFGNDVLDSPVHALLHLHQVLQGQRQFTPLAAGEVISTGTWTDAHPIAAGETWTTAFSGVTLPGLSVSFT
jgi:2-keto-4-pentenoate hydratase